MERNREARRVNMETIDGLSVRKHRCTSTILHDLPEEGELNLKETATATATASLRSPPWKVTDEKIGVSVPKKARSGSVKRLSNEYQVSNGGIFGEALNYGPSNSPDDLEIEIAEVLYGLRMQSQGPKMHETTGNLPKEIKSNDSTCLSHGPKRRKHEVEDGFTFTHAQSGSSSSVVIMAGTEQSIKMEVSSAKSKNISECKDKALYQDASKSTPALIGLPKEISAAIKSPLCLKLNEDLGVSTMSNLTSTLPAIHCQHEEKFTIDLMALPPLEIDDPINSEFDLKLTPNGTAMEKAMVMDEQNVEKILKKEVMVEGFGERKLDTNVGKGNLEMQFHDNGIKLQQAHKQQQPILKGPKAQPNSLSFPITVPGLPGGFPSGFIPPIQRPTSIDGSSRSSATVPHPHIIFSQPRSKRCKTHHYIACNIYSHQQLTKTNQFWPITTSSVSSHGTKAHNLNFTPPLQNRVLGNPLQVSISGESLISKGPGPETFTVQSGEEKNSEAVNSMDTAQKKQVVFQQAPPPFSASNLQHSPDFIFPKSDTSTKAPLSNAMSLNYQNLPSNEAQYMAALQNNSPFPISTTVGSQSSHAGAMHAQAMPFFTGPFYSSQMFHPSQIQQQQPYTKIQPAHQNANTLKNKQQSQKQYEPSTNELSKDTTIVNESRALLSQKSLYKQNFAAPVQQLNFGMMPDNNIEKQEKAQNSNIGVGFNPNQSIANYHSFNGNYTAKDINFSSTAQNPAIFQNMSGVFPHGFMVSSPPKGKASSEMPNGDDVRTSMAVKYLNSQQQHQQIHLQKQQQMMIQQQQMIIHHLQQQEPAGRKAPFTNGQPSFNDASMIQNNDFGPSAQIYNSSRIPFSQTISPYPLPRTSLTPKNISLQLGSLHGHTQISFGENNTKSVTSQSQTKSSSLLVGMPSDSLVSNNVGGNLATPKYNSKQAENSTTSPQSSTPGCGRNVPSIISTRHSQVSELKY